MSPVKILWTIIFAGLFFSCSCANPGSVKQDAQQQLEKRYGEKFDILSYTEIVLEKPRYDMRACPHDRPSQVFELSMTKESGVVLDNYVNMRWVYEASDELKAYLKQSNKKIAVLVEPRFDYLQTVDDRNIPPFSEALKHQQNDDYLLVTVYFFKDYTDSTRQEIFDEIRKVISYYNDKKILSVRYKFRFYDELFFKDLDTDNQFYNFDGRVFHFPESFETTFRKQVRYSLIFDTTHSDTLPSDSFLKEKMVDWKTLNIK